MEEEEEDALTTIGNILQAMLSVKGPKNVSQALECLQQDHKKLVGIQEKEDTSGKVGSTKEAADARLAVRDLITYGKKALQDLLGSVRSSGWGEGLANFQAFPAQPIESAATILRDCQERFRAGVEKYHKAPKITHRGWEKNKPPHFEQGLLKVTKFRNIWIRLRDEEKQKVIVHGMFGMGKSALALDLASTLSKGFDYPGGVHFIVFGQAYGPRSVTDEKVCSELLRILKFWDERGLEKANRQLPRADKKEQIKRILGPFVSKYRCLFVLDDVWNPDIVSDFIFGRSPANLLVTTRINDQRFADYTCVEIKPDDYMHSGLDELIFKRNAGIQSGIPAHLQASARTIIGKCYGSPLALTIVGNALKGKTRPHEWQRAAEEFGLYAQHGLSRDGYASTMFQGVKSSIHSPRADALEPLGFFRPGVEIPEDLLKMAWKIHKQADTFRVDVEALTSVHLLEQRENQGGRLYWCHPIVSEYIFDDLHLKERNFLSHDRQFYPLRRGVSVDNSIHLFCAFLLTYGHQVVTLKSAELLFGEFAPDIMEGDVHEVKALTSEIWRLSDEQLPSLKDKVIAATLGSWGLAKVIQTGPSLGLRDLEMANQLQPDNAVILRSWGVAHFILGNFEDASNHLSSANELQPHDPLTLLFLKAASMGMSNRENVQPVVKMDTNTNTGTDDMSLGMQALFEWKRGSLDSALQLLEKCRRANPYVLSILGAIKVELGEQGAARVHLEEVLSMEDAAFARCMRGVSSLQNGQYAAALEDLDRALELEPGNSLFLSVRGEIYRMLAEYEAASGDLEKALNGRSDDDQFTLRSLINVKWMQGKFEEAIELANGVKPTEGDRISGE